MCVDHVERILGEGPLPRKINKVQKVKDPHTKALRLSIILFVSGQTKAWVRIRPCLSSMPIPKLEVIWSGSVITDWPSWSVSIQALGRCQPTAFVSADPWPWSVSTHGPSWCWPKALVGNNPWLQPVITNILGHCQPMVLVVLNPRPWSLLINDLSWYQSFTTIGTDPFKGHDSRHLRILGRFKFRGVDQC